MATLTEEAKEAIEKKVDESIKEYKQAIYILKTYRWVAGILLAALGIGGFLGIDAWIEKKVNTRMTHYDEFMNAETLIGKYEYEKAYELMKSAWQGLKDNGVSSPSLKNIYYNDMITILSNMITYDQYARTFSGNQTWKSLNKDNDFLDILDNYTGNYYSRINLSICKIKFEDSLTALKELNLIETISNNPDISISSHGESEKYDRLWYPFIVNFIKKDNKKATKYRDSLKSINNDFFQQWIFNNHINKDHYGIIYWKNINNKINNENDNTFISRLEDFLEINKRK